MRLRKEKRPPTAARLLPDISQAILGTTEPQLTSPSRPRLAHGQLPCFLCDGSVAGHNPHLSPIEYLWAIVQDKVDKMNSAPSEATLMENVRSPWCSISAETMENLMRCMGCLIACGSMWRSVVISNNQLRFGLFVFLFLHAIEGAIDLGTPCRS